ncbi:hypothetical protein TWF128_010896 [Orbilia oligospora]|nr:hypothetical protein TWF128_010896 [Orbilia oligospora]
MHSHPQSLSTSSPHMPIGLELEPHYDHLASPEFLSFERAGSKAWEAYCKEFPKERVSTLSTCIFSSL